MNNKPNNQENSNINLKTVQLDKIDMSISKILENNPIKIDALRFPNEDFLTELKLLDGKINFPAELNQRNSSI